MDILKDNIAIIECFFVVIIGVGIFFLSKPAKPVEAQSNKNDWRNFMKKLLIVVDYQKDFVNGSLGFKEAEYFG